MKTCWRVYRSRAESVDGQQVGVSVSGLSLMPTPVTFWVSSEAQQKNCHAQRREVAEGSQGSIRGEKA